MVQVVAEKVVLVDDDVHDYNDSTQVQQAHLTAAVRERNQPAY